jgi:two-component system KDP operon response regulator KdpE
VIGGLQLSRVLIIGEGSRQAEAVAARLRRLGIVVDASSAYLTSTARAIFSFRPDLVLMTSDGSDPRDLFRFISEISDLPIVVLGGADGDGDVVWYLRHGAVDYYPPEISDGVFSARMCAMLRRLDASRPRGVLQIGSLEVDAESHVVRKAGELVQLTPTEFRMLRVLAENADRPCEHAMLLERVWGAEFRGCSHYLRLYIGYLRQKIEDDPKRPRMLLTEWGIGYRLVAGDPSPVTLTGGKSTLVPA